MAKAELREKAHIEYITTNISARDLAKKYGVSDTAVFNWMKAGGWADERESNRNRADKRAKEKLEQKRKKVAQQNEQKVEQHINAMADRLTLIYACADLTVGRAMEIVQSVEGISPRDLNSIMNTLVMAKRDVYGITDEKQDDGNNEVRLIVDGGDELDA